LRLLNWKIPRLQAGDDIRVGIDRCHLVSDGRQTCCCNGS